MQSTVKRIQSHFQKHGRTERTGQAAHNISELQEPLLANHRERHSRHGPVIRDIIIGFADGLTVPFALTAGLSS